MEQIRWVLWSAVLAIGVSASPVGAAEPTPDAIRAMPMRAGTAAASSGSDSATESLQSQLLREVGAGAAVAVVPSPQGLLAISSDGARRRTLATGAVSWVSVDYRGQVVWFKKAEGTELWLLDLMQPTLAAERVAVGVGSFAITLFYPARSGGAAERLASLSSHYDGSVEVWVDDPPALHLEKGIYDATYPEGLAQKRRAFKQSRLTPAGLALLPKLARRGLRRHIELAVINAKEPPRVTTVPKSRCDNDPEQCGVARAIPGTPLWIVTVGNSCGDACHTEYQLYDPRTRQFIDPMSAGRRSPLPLEGDWDELRDFYVAPDGSALLMSGHIYRLDGQSFDAGEGAGGGWLGGAWHISR